MTEWAQVSRHRKPWREADIDHLRAALRDDETIAEIAGRLGRTREAVSTMARKVINESMTPAGK
jgi:hypothetical protein